MPAVSLRGGQIVLWSLVGGAFLLGLAWRERFQVKDLDLRVFDSPDAPGSGRCMDASLVKMLAELARQSGYPVFDHINSAARTPEHNRKVGGVANSSHLIPTCRAVDIHTPGRELQRQLASAAVAIGITRIGIGRNFIHLDNDPTKTQRVAWGYPAGTPPPFNPFG